MRNGRTMMVVVVVAVECTRLRLWVMGRPKAQRSRSELSCYIPAKTCIQVSLSLSIYILDVYTHTHTSISLDKFAAIHPFIQKQPLRWEWFLHDQVGTNEFSRFLSKVWPETITSVIFYKKKLTPCYSHEGQTINQ